MSLVMNFKKFSKNSDSFDDRFCDDLCEDILQYLPLKDKLRLEKVSKQFQRTVFRKQYSLTLYKDDRLIYYFKVKMLTKERYMKLIESLLKKCPNIERIDCSILENYENRKNIFQIITKYCNHLIEFKSFLINLNEPEFKEFHQKFGSKLKKFPLSWNLLKLNLFPNLESLDTYHFHLDDILQLGLRQLKELDITLIEGNEELFREVLQKFNKIRHLTLNINTEIEKSVFTAFQESPVFQKLIELKLSTNYDQTSVFNIYCLKQMVKICPNLKSIEIIRKIFLENVSDFKQILSSLKTFPHLKRLDIIFVIQIRPRIRQNLFIQIFSPTVDSFESWNFVRSLTQ